MQNILNIINPIFTWSVGQPCLYPALTLLSFLLRSSLSVIVAIIIPSNVFRASKTQKNGPSVRSLEGPRSYIFFFLIRNSVSSTCLLQKYDLKCYLYLAAILKKFKKLFMNSVILRLGYFLHFSGQYLLFGVCFLCFNELVFLEIQKGSITFSADHMTSELSVNFTHSPSDHFIQLKFTSETVLDTYFSVHNF